MANRPTSNPIEIRLTPAQRNHYFRRTGMFLRSISLPPAQLKRLSVVAVKAGSEALPISRSAVRQVLEPKPSSEQGGDPFVVEVALTPEQREQIGRATGNVFASLRIGPHDFPVTYHETWDDATPVRIGRTMVIKPAGKPYETSDADRIIELPAGDGSGQGVFGTGRHPTTRLSLILLEGYVESGDRVLDLGTGSGILAVAAAKLGAGEVLALDTEAAAVAFAQEVVSLNGLAYVVEVGQGSVESAAPPYEVVVANIFPNAIIELAPKLATTVRRGGVLITSGSVVARAEETADAVCAAGFGLEQRRPQDDWVGMAFRKP
ncbi:MAG: Ribosomal protein L11 methyltransferase [uncultured Rubrobacteraceae bacterium]|uniref:Ribosomal protein L11 methyltransferase n=1 Tax=uncultured Rubrobacteraceae bacterium TaxID=349277 RepID=A0A6J4QID1_9ACTN|nr:MAG: Ribosomal protein L11 methyltransferase [uncultured Rubrobacteraceae bacterium]